MQSPRRRRHRGRHNDNHLGHRLHIDKHGHGRRHRRDIRADGQQQHARSGYPRLCVRQPDQGRNSRQRFRHCELGGRLHLPGHVSDHHQHISPNTGPASGGTAVTITGSNFTPGSTVSIGGTVASSVTVVDSTTLNVTVPAYVSGSLSEDVVVNNGVADASLAGGFTYTASSPNILSVSPTIGSTAGGTTVTISGSGFVPGTTVTIGGISAVGVNVINVTTITAVTPAHASGSTDVVVSASGFSSTLTNAFTYISLDSTSAGFSPTRGRLPAAQSSP